MRTRPREQPFKDDCELYITVNDQGSIVYENILIKRWPGELEMGNRLWSIIEDHVIDNDIDWWNVWKDDNES